MLRSLFSLCLTLVFLTIGSDGRSLEYANEEDYVEMFDENEFSDVSLDQMAKLKAVQHVNEIERKVCSTPVPKLVPVHTIYPSDKRFRPHCVELHKCGNDAGCCKNETMECTAVESEYVHLYISSPGNSETKIFLMSFENDTRCECQPKGFVKPMTNLHLGK